MISLEELEKQALDEVAAAADTAALDAVRVSYLGKKGQLTQQLKQLGALPAAERPAAGQEINRIKARVQQALEARRDALQAAHLDARLASERIDVCMSDRTWSRAINWSRRSRVRSISSRVRKSR